MSLGETLIALAIAAVLVGLAMPSVRDWIAGLRQLNHAQHLAGTLHVARSEAIKRGGRIIVCKSRDRNTCDDRGSWNDGWIMYADRNRDGLPDADEPLIRAEGPAPGTITVTPNRPLDDYVSYTGEGTARMLDGALQMGTFSVCHPGQPVLSVILANSGRVRIARSTARCP